MGENGKVSGGREPSPYGLLTTAAARANDMTYRQLHRTGYMRRHRGLWVPADTHSSLHVRCAAALEVLPERSAISHVTAARLRELPLPPAMQACDEIHVTVPRAVDPRIQGIRVHRLDQPFRNEELCPGIVVTSAARTWLDLATSLRRDDHVALGDSILNRALATPELLAALLEVSKRRRGVPVSRARLPLLDGRSGSRPESWIRLILLDEGLTGFCVNEEITDVDGRVLLVPDIHFWAPRKVLLQYEGDHHRVDPEQWDSDIRRDDLSRMEGWHVIRLLKADLSTRRRMTGKRVRAALYGAG